MTNFHTAEYEAEMLARTVAREHFWVCFVCSLTRYFGLFIKDRLSTG